MNAYWNSHAGAGNDFFPQIMTRFLPDGLPGGEILIHHRGLGWYLLIAASATLTGPPVPVIDVQVDVGLWLAFD